jgi:hypothetical protein
MKWDVPFTGILALSGERTYLYAEEGLYHLEPAERTAKRLLSLSNTYQEMRTIASTADGGLVLIHADSYDRRLLRLDSQGALVWERSLMVLPRGGWQLLTTTQELYLLVSHTDSSRTVADIYAIDLDSATLTHILRGDSRQSYTRNTWMQPLGEGLWLLNVGGGPLGAFNLQAAYQRVTSP